MVNQKIKDRVELIIAENDVAVFSKTYCPYCKRAQDILSDYSKQNMKVIELDEDEDGAAIQDYLATRTESKQQTVPNIFIKTKHIGGCDDLTALHKRGAIKNLFKQREQTE